MAVGELQLFSRYYLYSHLEILRTPLLFLWPRKVSLLTSAQEVEVESMVASSTPSICGVLN
jgi:hypothetical protein